MHNNGGAPIATAELAVVFLDMSGYTALTEAHGDYIAARLAEDFSALTGRLIADEDRLVKSIGDAVLFTSPTARGALRSLNRIVRATHDEGPYPLLRGGVAYGTVLLSRGDIYGRTVNIAARLAAEAAPGQTIATQPVAAAAAEWGVAVTSLGQTTLRNMSQPLAIFAVDLDSDCHCGQIDPVCRMRLPRGTSAITRSGLGTTYRFCSASCSQRFTAQLGSSSVRRPSPEESEAWS